MDAGAAENEEKQSQQVAAAAAPAEWQREQGAPPSTAPAASSRPVFTIRRRADVGSPSVQAAPAATSPVRPHTTDDFSSRPLADAAPPKTPQAAATATPKAVFTIRPNTRLNKHATPRIDTHLVGTSSSDALLEAATSGKGKDAPALPGPSAAQLAARIQQAALAAAARPVSAEQFIREGESGSTLSPAGGSIRNHRRGIAVLNPQQRASASHAGGGQRGFCAVACRLSC